MRVLGTTPIGTALAIVLACPAAAQTDPDGVDAAILPDEIVVTAQKREERLIDVPAAVTAVSGEALTARNLTQIEQFAAYTPGMSFSQNLIGLQLTIRGLNASGQGATTAILVNDVALTSSSSYQQATGPNFDTYDLERIEVLRGPQGTLYGASALGGLVKYVTKAPNLTRFEGSGQLDLNHVDGGETGGGARLVLNVPIVEDSVAVRISGLYDRLPGYIDNVLGNRRNINGGDRYGLRGSLLWQVSPDFSVGLAGIWQRDELDALANVELVGAALTPATPPANAASIANGGRLLRNGRLGEPVDRESQVYSATLSYEAGPMSVTSITSLAKSQVDQRKVFTNYNAAPGVTFGDFLSALVYGQPVDVRASNRLSVRRINQEIRIASAPDTGLFGLPVDYLAGIFYTDEESSLRQIFDVTTVAIPPQLLTVPVPGGGVFVPASYRELAGFAQLTWHITPTLDLTGGGRYARNWQKSQSNKFAGFTSGSPVDITDPASKTSEGKATWSAALSWHPAERVTLYARAATGYRPGGPNIVPSSTPPAGFRTSYGADTTVNYEVGAKGELLDRRLAFDISAFTVKWSNIQIPTSVVDPNTGVPNNFTDNGSRARSRGVEYAFRLAVSRQLSLLANGAYTDAELRVAVPTIGGAPGDRLPYVPGFTNTLGFDFRLPLGSNTMFVGADWVYVGSRYSDFVFGGAAAPLTGHQRLPSYNTVNMRGGVDFGRHRLEAYVTNIGNARGLQYYASGDGTNGTGNGVIQQPRTVGLRLSSDW